MSVEGRRYHQVRKMSRSYSLTAQYLAQNEGFGFKGHLKGKSNLMIVQKHGNIKFAYQNREFWCKGYYADAVGENTAEIKSYKRTS